MPFAEDIAVVRAVAALRPHPARARYLRGDVCYCPLCGFTLADDWDGHFLPCLAQHAVVVWHTR